MADEVVSIRFDGTAEGLLAAARSVSSALGNIQKETKSMSAGTVASGVAMGNIMSTVATKAIAMGKDLVGSFQSAASETRKMQGIMGGTAEDVSRLRYAADAVGVSGQTVARSFAMLSTHMVANDKAASQLGVSYKNLDGSMKPPSQLMGEVADKLNSLGKGAERTAMAKKLLGRSFQELNPLLAQGSKGMADLAKEADATGNTLSGKDLAASKMFSMAVKEMHQFVNGLFITLGKTVIPVLGGLATMVDHAAIAIRKFVSGNTAAKDVLKVVGVALGGLLAIVGQYLIVTKAMAVYDSMAATVKAALGIATTAEAASTEAATVAQEGLNLAMEANPIGLIVMAVEGLIVAFVALMKASDTMRNIFTKVMTVLGTVVGDAVGLIVSLFRHMGDVWLNVAGAITKVAAKAFGWVPGLGGKLKSANNAVSDFHKSFDKTLTKVSDSAFKNGGKIGKSVGEGIGNAIKNFKLPSIKMPKATDTGGGGKDERGGGGGGGSTQKDQLKAAVEYAKKYWTDKVTAAKDALNEVQKAADDAKKKMSDYAASISSSLAGAFDVTNMVQSSFAKYLGAGALVAAFQKRLADMREFVTDLRALRDQGLPTAMLQQIAAAGVDGGLDAARLLVGNADAISQLRSVQADIDAQAAEAGSIVSTATYGQEVQTAEAAIAPARAALTSTEAAATAGGMAVTETAGSGGDINISVDVATNADPQQIADAVAFGLKTGTPPVLKKPAVKAPKKVKK